MTRNICVGILALLTAAAVTCASAQDTHFPFSDLNNLQIADLMSQFLEKKGLD